MPRATIRETWPGLFDLDVEDGRQRRLLTGDQVDALVREWKLVPYPKDGGPSEPEGGSSSAPDAGSGLWWLSEE